MPGVYAQGLCTMQSQPSIHSLSPGERGLGIGIENKHFFEKTDFFYKRQPERAVLFYPTQSELYLSTSDGTYRKNVTASCTEYLFYINYKAL
mgnify:CR=1 FL=1